MTSDYQVGTGSTACREVAAQLAKMFRDVVEVTDGVGVSVIERWRWTGRAWQREIT